MTALRGTLKDLHNCKGYIYIGGNCLEHNTNVLFQYQ